MRPGDKRQRVQRMWERGATDPLLYDAPGAVWRRSRDTVSSRCSRRQGWLTPSAAVSVARATVARGYRLGGRLAVVAGGAVSLEADAGSAWPPRRSTRSCCSAPYSSRRPPRPAGYHSTEMRRHSRHCLDVQGETDSFTVLAVARRLLAAGKGRHRARDLATARFRRRRRHCGRGRGDRRGPHALRAVARACRTSARPRRSTSRGSTACRRPPTTSSSGPAPRSSELVLLRGVRRPRRRGALSSARTFHLSGEHPAARARMVVSRLRAAHDFRPDLEDVEPLLWRRIRARRRSS